VKRYLDQLENADQQDEVIIDDRAVAAALEKLKNNPEPEARFMRMGHGNTAPAYNAQTAVDAKHGIILAQQAVPILGLISQLRRLNRHYSCSVARSC
jgi:hypothetical protein